MGTQERKERERCQRRAQILTSARNAFVKHGLSTTSMDRIAKEAELAKGTLYLYFRSKDELLMGLIANDMEMLIERINRIIDKPLKADEKLIQAFAEFHAFSKENQFFFQVMTQLNIVQMVNGDYSQETLEKFSSTNQNVVDLIKQIVQEGVDSNVFHLHASVHDVVVQLIIALKGSIVILKNNMVPPFWVRQEERELLEQIVRTLVRGISQQGLATNERGVLR
jgi:AcrR family transcriptional regulator